jgi:hypothetical protein
LLQNGADPGHRYGPGFTPLDFALEKGHVGIADVLAGGLG